MSLTKTGIEYGELAWNFYPGCLHKPQGICPVPRCWAEGMSKRQREDFHKPHLIAERLLDPLKRQKPARILVDFMGDLFGDWVNPEQTNLDNDNLIPAGVSLREHIIRVATLCPQHTFIFLTKAPLNYQKWGRFPDNCWLGATVWDNESHFKASSSLMQSKAKHKWLSIEPFLGEINPHSLLKVDWIVIGAQTQPSRMPELAWVKEIVEAADDAGIPIFLKNNLKPLFEGKEELSWMVGWLNKPSELRQEVPA